MEEGFKFVVFNASHKLKDGEYVNPETKVTIEFPSKSSYFIVFHGRLVHNGDCSITNTDGTTMNSPRLFSYLTVPDHNASFNGNCRTTPRLISYKSRLKEGKVDRDSFSIQKASEEIETLTIKLPSNSSDIKTSSKSVKPLIGNMNLDGWEVYEGINFNRDFLRNYSKDLNHVILSKTKEWKGISSTNRKMFVLSDVSTLTNVFKKNRSLYNAFDDILRLRLRKIPYLEEVQMEKMIILANLGPVAEQEPHRDYSTIRK